jgi:4-diphosphocytidyl-2-C-methyl-D-erythritol kinase
VLNSVEVAAPAKINPLLDVLARRADGFHEVSTLMVALEFGDRLRLERVDGPPGALTLELEGPFASADVPRDGRNLALRALGEALKHLPESPPALRLTLTKEVPSQAGLGGGSSDGAAAVLGAETLLGVDLGSQVRAGLLGALGSDCVFFDGARDTGVALATGRGERLEPFTAPGADWWVVVLTPEQRCPTAEVYAAIDWPLSPPPSVPTVTDLLGMRATEARVSFRNQLEAAALAVSPGLQLWRDALDAAGEAHFRLSGSGSSFFGLYDTADQAGAGLDRVLTETARRALPHRGHWVTRTCGHGARILRTNDRPDPSRIDA